MAKEEMNVIIKKSDSKVIFKNNNNSKFKILLNEPITLSDGWAVSLSSLTYKNSFKVFPNSSVQHIVFYDARSKYKKVIEIKEEEVDPYNPGQLRHLLQTKFAYLSPDDSQSVHINYKKQKLPGVIRVTKYKEHKEFLFVFISFDLAKIMGFPLIKPSKGIYRNSL